MCVIANSPYTEKEIKCIFLGWLSPPELLRIGDDFGSWSEATHINCRYARIQASDDYTDCLLLSANSHPQIYLISTFSTMDL